MGEQKLGVVQTSVTNPASCKLAGLQDDMHCTGGSWRLTKNIILLLVLFYLFIPLCMTQALGATLTVQLPGSGTGTVNSSPSGITCPVSCSDDFTSVSLYATPGSDSLFSGWGGACAGLENCTLDLSGDTTVTALFTLKSSPVQVSGSYYGALQNAYESVAADGVVMAVAQAQPGDLTLDRDISFTLKGGYDTGFSSNSGNVTYVDGAVSIASGSMTVENITIGPSVSSSPPAAPFNVIATPGSGQVSLSWDTVCEATSYNAYYSTATGVTRATGTKVTGTSSASLVVTGLTNGTTYYFVVTTVSANGESVESGQVIVTPVQSAPAAPTGVSAISGDGQGTISWSTVSGATSYNIYYSSSSAVSKATGTKVTGAVSPQIVSGLTNGTLYYFVVTAVNGGGESADSSPAVHATPVAPSTGSYYQSGGSVSKTGQTYTSSTDDVSGVKVVNSGSFTLSGSVITTSGNTSSQDNSSFYGQNAGVLATSASTINLSNCVVTTTGTGANGVFATGTGSSITLSKVTINCSADGAHGVDATLAGVLELTDVTISTAGAHGAAISTDRGGGTITVNGGTATASGTDSPGIYSTGTITVSDAVISGKGAEGAVIEGANSITLTNTAMSGAKGTRDRGLLIYQSMSGDAQGTEGTFTMTGGSFTWPSTTGPAFYVTNSTGVITLKGVTISNSSGTLVKAGADQWGTSGSNGGTVIFTADGQTLTGSMVADSISSLSVTLKNSSSLTGAINSANTANSVALTLDSSSAWNVTADSYVTTLTDASASFANIISNGHSVCYKTSANGSTTGNYSLSGGGTLKPCN